jgi:hypothetical protein
MDKIFLTSTSHSISGGKPNLLCSNCKWFISNENKEDLEDGFCEIFKNNDFKNNNLESRYKHVIECRKNNLLCGKNGYYFEPKTKNYQIMIEEEKSYLKELEFLKEKMIEMEEQNCGEVNEIYDLDNWEKEYKHIKNRIEKIIKSRGNL